MLSNRSNLPLCQVSMLNTLPISRKCDITVRTCKLLRHITPLEEIDRNCLQLSYALFQLFQFRSVTLCAAPSSSKILKRTPDSLKPTFACFPSIHLNSMSWSRDQLSVNTKTVGVWKILLARTDRVHWYKSFYFLAPVAIASFEIP